MPKFPKVQILAFSKCTIFEGLFRLGFLYFLQIVKSISFQDNASYHTCDSDAPKANANVKTMIEWLDKKEIKFPDKWRLRGYKDKLKELVKQHKEENPEYNAEAMAKKYGVTILRLPPYHCEL